jgi:predicted metal-dependent HD superfamily phosphohydrolase
MFRRSPPHRRYHTVQHLDECFAWLPKTRPLAQYPYEIELGLWFHDAIYDVKRQDNERKSAEWAKAAGLRCGLPAPTAERVYDLVMVTRHRAQPEDIDAKILVDIDLSIMGAPSERFDEYERQVREEYAWVPGLFFHGKRRQILEEFIARPRIFNTDCFVESHEAQARSNLQRSLEKLGG